MRGLQRLDFQKIVENADEGIFLIGTDGVLQYSNPAGERMLGYPRGSLVGVPIEQFIAPESRKKFLEDFDKVRQGRAAPERYELMFLTMDGGTRHAEAISSAVVVDGKTAWIQAIVRDMTDADLLRTKLLNEKRRTENLIEEASSIVVGVDTDFVVNIFNQGAMRALGYTKADTIGRSLGDIGLIGPPASEGLRAGRMDSASNVHRTAEGWATCRSGERKMISWTITPTFDEEGHVSGSLAIGTDVTSRETLATVLSLRNRLLTMQAEIGLLAASSASSRALMEDGLKLMASNFDFKRGEVHRIAPDGGMIEVGTFGDAPNEQERRLHELVMRLALATGEPLFLPEEGEGLGLDDLVAGKGSIVVLPLKGRSAPVGAICMCSSLASLDSERKNALVSLASLFGFALENAQLAEKLNRANEQLQLYNDMITHDVVNYALPISSYIDLLSRKDITEERRTAYLTKMKESARQLQEFLHKAHVLVRAAERPESELRPMGLMDALRTSAGTSEARYQNVKIEIVPEDGPTAVYADDALPEVFTNLFMNAIKYSAPEPVTARIVVDRDRRTARVEVEDHGPGIPDDLKWKVFERRFSKKSAGAPLSSGLGLAIVRALVENYGGKVWADDRVKGEPGKGAKMVVELRLAG